jgi:hypothetical protein
VHEQLGRQLAVDNQAHGDDGVTDQQQATSVPVVSMHQLWRALSKARPSLPATEQRRLAAVYARFQQSRDPGLSNRQLLEEEALLKKHATLA